MLNIENIGNKNQKFSMEQGNLMGYDWQMIFIVP